MKVRIERDAFADTCAWVLRSVGTRATLPVLGGVLVIAEGSDIRLLGTDLEVGAEAGMGASPHLTDMGGGRAILLALSVMSGLGGGRKHGAATFNLHGRHAAPGSRSRERKLAEDPRCGGKSSETRREATQER